MIRGLLWWGLPNLHVAITNREPLEITCADYLKQRPDAKWLRLTQCVADLENIVYEEATDKEIRKVYIPLRAQGDEKQGRTQIVIERDDQEARDVMAKLRIDSASDSAMKRLTALLDDTPEGLVKFGIDLSDKDQEQLREKAPGLADDFIIMDRGAKPKLLLGLITSLLGLGIVGFVVFRLIRRRKPAQ